MNRIRTWIGLALLGALPSLGGCNLLKVEAPGHITDTSLDKPDAFPSLVNGMAFDLAQANDNVAEIESMASGEVWHGGSYDWGKIPRGIILPEDVDGAWEALEQAQWVSDDGLDRMSKVLGPDEVNQNKLMAEANLYGGFSDRLFGEMACQVVIDSGAPQPNTVEFDRAIDKFTNAITIGQTVGDNDIVTAAYGGRASVRAWKGDWAGAVDDAKQVPIDFEYDAILNAAANNQNTLAYETHARYEYTIWNTLFANHYGDPRAPWDTVFTAAGAVARGANGQDPMYQQQKYKDVNDDFPLTKGTEMLVLRAEAALRNGPDIALATTLLDSARAFYKMPALAASSMATIDSAWATLRYERAATTFLENRHLWDVRRFYDETGPAHDNFLKVMAVDSSSVRDGCIPISKEEANSNPNIP